MPIQFLAPTNDRDRLPRQGYWNVGFDRIANVPPDVPDLETLFAETFNGQLLAWDPLKQEVRWKGDLGRPTGGGVLSTGGNLVFQGNGGTEIMAYDAANGERLWSYDVQTIAMAPPITYALDGMQYVAAAVGFGGGAGAEAGAITHGWNIPNRSRVLVFKLGGQAELPPLTEQQRTLQKPPVVTADAGVVKRGQVIFQRHCSYCHGDGLRTGGLTPDLRYSGEQVHGMWQDIVRGGTLSPVGMVSFAEYIDADDAEAIRQYVLSEANKLYLQQHSAEDGK